MNWKHNNRNRTVLILAFMLFLGVRIASGQVVCDSLTAANIVARKQQEYFSPFHVGPAELRQIIAPLGETDIIKYVQRLPGISSGMEGFSSFSVRGGNMGNNHLSLDGVTVYGTTHLFGLTSAVSPDIVGSTDFCLGGFGGDDGNLLASHIRMHSAEASDRFQGSASIGNLMGSISLRTPIVENRLSALLSVRISPAQWEYNTISRKWIPAEAGLPERISALTCDLYGKISAQVSDKSTAALSWLYTDDRYGFVNRAETAHDSIAWNNNIVLFRWGTQFSSRWNFSLDLSRNLFVSGQQQERTLSGTDRTTPIEVRSQILELRGVAKVSFIPAENWTLSAGAEYNSAQFHPRALKPAADERQIFQGDEFRSRTAVAFGEVSFENERLRIRSAARMSSYHAGDKYRGFFPEWHFLANYFLFRNLALELTYDRMTQFYHTLEGIPTGISTDIVVPSGQYAAPEKARQLYGGIRVHLGKYRFIVGGYQKTMSGLVYHRNAERFFQTSSSSWKDELSLGSGTSHGMELLAIRDGKRFFGQIAYTLSETDRTFPDINDGKPFPYKFDRSHILNVNAAYMLTPAEKRAIHSLSAQFTLTSGHYETLQAGHYGSWFLPIEVDLPYYTHPNNYRMPSYIRLDLAYNFSFRTTALRHDLSLGIYNVLNRHNAFSLTWDMASRRWKKLSILPILPNIKYAISF